MKLILKVEFCLCCRHCEQRRLVQTASLPQQLAAAAHQGEGIGRRGRRRRKDAADHLPGRHPGRVRRRQNGPGGPVHDLRLHQRLRLRQADQ
jgi:hypothetical protein